MECEYKSYTRVLQTVFSVTVTYNDGNTVSKPNYMHLSMQDSTFRRLDEIN